MRSMSRITNLNEYWGEYINPERETLIELSRNLEDIYLGKSDMYSFYEEDPKNAWKYIFADFNHFDLWWTYTRMFQRNRIPPKSAINLLLQRFENELVSKGDRLFGEKKRLLDLLEEYKDIDKFKKALENHPWDKTPIEEIKVKDINEILERYY